MDILEHVFNERLSEIDSYLDLLASVEQQVQSGPPRVGPNGPVISAVQQKILYSSVYLQLYNLVEATITKCVDAVCTAIAKDNRCYPADLSAELRREWVRYLARTHTDLNFENRLASSLKLCEHLIQTLPIGNMVVEKGNGGNWDDEEIYRLASRLGCPLVISAVSNAAVKRPFRNDLGALALIVRFRNELAHGSLSFAECGEGVTVAELRELKSRSALYLSEVVSSFRAFVTTYGFLAPGNRPTNEANA